ncbi:hypothetical protein DFJ73DRAFT_758851 [Zopfochytrium polystomum]|nr:hypothetical protein DFJ73DRAFT_758851 [Zopfochytrium polystomum]
MDNEWQPETNCTAGSRVTYEGIAYSAIQPHMSQAVWRPKATPALWAPVLGWNASSFGGMAGYTQTHGSVAGFTRLAMRPTLAGPQAGFGAPQAGGHQPGYAPPQGGHEQTAQPGNNFQQVHGQPAGPENQQIGSNTAMVAGSITAGAAVFGAGAYSVHRFSESHSEDQKRQQWVHTFSAQQQQARGGPVYWCLCDGKNIPSDAIQLGTESDGLPLDAGRCYFQGGVQVGKAGRMFGLNISYGGKEVNIQKAFQTWFRSAVQEHIQNFEGCGDRLVFQASIAPLNVQFGNRNRRVQQGLDHRRMAGSDCPRSRAFSVDFDSESAPFSRQNLTMFTLPARAAL